MRLLLDNNYKHGNETVLKWIKQFNKLLVKVCFSFTISDVTYRIVIKSYCILFNNPLNFITVS